MPKDFDWSPDSLVALVGESENGSMLKEDAGKRVHSVYNSSSIDIETISYLCIESRDSEFFLNPANSCLITVQLDKSEWM